MSHKHNYLKGLHSEREHQNYLGNHPSDNHKPQALRGICPEDFADDWKHKVHKILQKW